MNREVEKFSNLAPEWWNKDSGPFRVLHQINKLRSRYIIDVINSFSTLKKISILDVGCGGGILTESLASQGYDILGIDLSSESINNAKLNSRFVNACYDCIPIENVQKKFDVIVIMEVLEHVENITDFLSNCVKCLESGGILFFSTINKTLKSFLFAILIAEYVAKMLPKGTHDWNTFIKPSDLYCILQANKLLIKDLKGMEYNLFYDDWALTQNIKVNYLGYATFM